ncbi:MAG: hypothetical protein RLZZ156_2599 [Deinococcota bacterium]|jgi:trypsin
MKKDVLKTPLLALANLALILMACGSPTPPAATTVSLGGAVFDDLNKNGTREAGELGLKDWTVYVDTNSNGALDAGEKSVLTTAAGSYTLTEVPQGNVKVGVKMRLGYNAAQSVTLTSSQLLQPQIINGTVVANATVYPFQVALVNKNNTGFAFCGGSLIAPRWVLTAAHCFFNGQTPTSQAADIQVRSGVTDLAADPPQGQFLDVTQIIRHPDYANPSGLNNDMLLLKLAANATATPVIPASAAETNLNSAGTAARVIGWGRTSNGGASSTVLREVGQEIATDTACQVAWNATSKMLCAKTPTGDNVVRESCQGDSGGPLFTQNPLRQVGVVSFGSQTCEEINTPGVYARVTEYDAWLATNTGRTATDAAITLNLTADTTNAGIGVRQSD